MDKCVNGENEMWKMPAKERIQTRISSSSSSAVKRVLDSRFAPRHSPEDVQVKRNTRTTT